MVSLPTMSWGPALPQTEPNRPVWRHSSKMPPLWKILPGQQPDNFFGLSKMNTEFNNKLVDHVGNALVGLFHRLALFGIGAATIWAAGWEFLTMFEKHHASVQDLLLMFIYLEIGAMVGIYFKTNHMPVRFLVYIAITAITRYIVDLVAAHNKLWEIVAMSGSILILALSVLLVRMASTKFPSTIKQDDIV